VKVNRIFAGTYHLHLRGRRVKQAGHQEESGSKRSRCLSLLSVLSWRSNRCASPKCRFTTGLHDVISYKMELFILTSVRTANPPCLALLCSQTFLVGVLWSKELLDGVKWVSCGFAASVFVEKGTHIGSGGQEPGQRANKRETVALKRAKHFKGKEFVILLGLSVVSVG
jgi:hypothetical protein